MPIRAKHHGLAIEQSVVDGQGRTASRIPGNLSVKSVPHLDQRVTRSASFASEEPIAVVFHLMQPAWPGRRGADEGRAARLEETGRRFASGNTPQHAPIYRGPAISRRGH